MTSAPRPYRALSLWLDQAVGQAGDDLAPRPALPGDTSVDVAIIGAGFTGLWTAYYLSSLDPSIRIAVLEAEVAGFGASGRNGGWCSSFLPMGHDAMAATAGPGAARAMQIEMHRTVDEVGRVAAIEGIDCHFVKGGTLDLATTPLQARRARRLVEAHHRHGFTPDDLRWLDEAEARARVQARDVHGATYSPHCAAIQPALLARGLARAVERRGVAVHERTRALRIERGRVATDHGALTADVVVRATEGFSPRLPGLRRAIVPLYSLMIATEPLPSAFWDQLGWAGRETVADHRHLIIYAQRTADDRIAFGGRGAPYHFGSRVDARFDREPAVFADLGRVLVDLFPAVRDARITHTWGGPLGAPRDWYCSVGLDRRSGLAWAGGYVGDGVATTNLAGRTLADLVLGRDSDLTRLPWVGHVSPKWEPEPLRWLAINGLLRMARSIDRTEARTGHRARRREMILERLLGR